MEIRLKDDFGNSFERIAVSIIAMITGLILAYLAVLGPLCFNLIKYKTSASMVFQIEGQDLVNLIILAPLLIAGGILLFARKPLAKYFLICTPLYLIYYVLSYSLGIEWSSSSYSGNSEKYAFYFILILISALVILLYSIAIFPRNRVAAFNKKGLMVYSGLFVLFMLLFASMWIKDVSEVIINGSAIAYLEAPTGFWVIKFFDLGFTIPLGLISVYLLWARPEKAYHIQMLFYGFFATMVLAVDAMVLVMYLKKDPNLTVQSTLTFSILAVIIFCGFGYIQNNYHRST